MWRGRGGRGGKRRGAGEAGREVWRGRGGRGGRERGVEGQGRQGERCGGAGKAGREVWRGREGRERGAGYRLLDACKCWSLNQDIDS